METFNKLKYLIDFNDKTGNYKIEISLDDDCHNGHNDFSMTATFWQIGMMRVARNMICSGCCHDDILKIRHDLKIFADLDNFIYYDHTNKGVFNWRDASHYRENITQEQFNDFLEFIKK